jgi:polyketide biosynthesis acyl carrier protein
MTTADVFEVVVRCTREVVPRLKEHVLLPEHRLEQLGANSVDRAEIIMMVLESLSLKLARIEAFGPSNLGELAEMLHERLYQQ